MGRLLFGGSRHLLRQLSRLGQRFTSLLASVLSASGLIGERILGCLRGGFVGFAQRFGEYAGVVLTTVLGGMLLTDVLAARSVRRLFADAGDIHAREAS